jgi:hypothetical protein
VKKLALLAATAFMVVFLGTMVFLEQCRDNQTFELQKRSTKALEDMAAKKCQ